MQAKWFTSDLLWSSVHITPPCPRLLLSAVTDFSKRASFPIVCVDWFYKKAVSGVVKSWEFEGILRCSKILRIRRKNPMKWVSRDHWVYLDITLQSFEIWEFWGEFWGIETFYRSKFSPATGVKSRCNDLKTGFGQYARAFKTQTCLNAWFRTCLKSWSNCHFITRLISSMIYSMSIWNIIHARRRPQATTQMACCSRLSPSYACFCAAREARSHAGAQSRFIVCAYKLSDQRYGRAVVSVQARCCETTQIWPSTPREITKPSLLAKPRRRKTTPNQHGRNTEQNEQARPSLLSFRKE